MNSQLCGGPLNSSLPDKTKWHGTSLHYRLPNRTLVERCRRSPRSPINRTRPRKRSDVQAQSRHSSAFRERRTAKNHPSRGDGLRFGGWNPFGQAGNRRGKPEVSLRFWLLRFGLMASGSPYFCGLTHQKEKASTGEALIVLWICVATSAATAALHEYFSRRCSQNIATRPGDSASSWTIQFVTLKGL